MDSNSAEVALLSIRPHFAEAILNGRKRVEFRRTRFAREISHVVIYATQPIGKVVGWFEVAGIESHHLDDLWGKFQHCGGISEEDFRAYYSGRDNGVAIRVRKSQRLKRAKCLSAIANSMRAPQCFMYLDQITASRVIE